MTNEATDDITYEEAMAELESLVEAAEEDDIALDALIKNYERGQQLLKRCRTLLNDAELKLKKLDINSEKLEDVE